MKKDRACAATPYPVYGMQQPMMGAPMAPNMAMNPNMMGPMNPNMGYPMPLPGMMNPNMAPMPNMTPNTGMSSQTVEGQLSSLNSQVNSLERRVSTLESMMGPNNTNYNTSNFQMM